MVLLKFINMTNYIGFFFNVLCSCSKHHYLIYYLCVIVLFLVFETSSHDVAQAGLKLASLLNAGITGMSQHTKL
jgi:hypothetical protein